MTPGYWALVAGFVTPLLVSAVYGAVVLEPSDPPGLPWYPVLVFLPPLLVVGGVLSFVLQRPRSTAARFALGLALGGVVFIIGQTDAIRF